MEFLSEYGLFLLKAVTIVVAVLFVAGGLASLAQRNQRHAPHGSIRVESLNDEFEEMADRIRAEVLPEDVLKREHKERRKREKAREKEEAEHPRRRVFVLDFAGDIQASAAEDLRHEITAVLAVAGEKDEVVVRLDSGGGLVTGYGFAASQLERIRRAKIPLTVCVDEIAASGGYMMACVADRVLAAPFAIVGSIGVVAQLPNFHRLLKKHEVDIELHTAGEYKRTLTVFGENTDKAREKFREELEDAHQLFKQFITRWRPQVDIAAVATGEHWFALRGQELKLVDELMTSDEYLVNATKDAEVFHVHWHHRKTFAERMGFAVESAFDRALVRWWGRLTQRNLL
ncbi:MAG: protease SohB [Pseudomonadota bacterium]